MLYFLLQDSGSYVLYGGHDVVGYKKVAKKDYFYLDIFCLHNLQYLPLDVKLRRRLNSFQIQPHEIDIVEI
jgi:hypothetical protein